MKFCKSLQRMMDISDPEWAPYYTNYKMLKKIIKELPHHHHHPPEEAQSDQLPPRCVEPRSPPGMVQQQSGGETASECAGFRTIHSSGSIAAAAADSRRADSSSVTTTECPQRAPSSLNTNAAILTNPVEQNFFRLLHQEVRKVSYFHHKLMDELSIRYERIQCTVQKLLDPDPPPPPPPRARSYSVYKLLSEEVEEDRNPPPQRTPMAPNPSHHPARLKQHYFLCNQSIYKLYRDLMFLELYSIMAFTSFSKILKKHDKVTGYSTKYAFMTKIVLPANFVATAPQTMMEQCLLWYDSITHVWMQDERDEDDDSLLFLDMIRRLRSHSSVVPPRTE